jgi:hypothetical protein
LNHRETRSEITATDVGNHIFFLFDWIQNHEPVIWWTGSLSVLMFVGFLLAMPVIIIKLPAEYFLKHEMTHHRKELSFMGLVYLIFKNVFGGFLVLAGIVMLFLPGQGLITLIMGISLLSIPDKKRMVRKIIRRKKVLSTMNRIRLKFNKPPLQI